MTPDIALRPAHLLAHAIRCREVSSRELLDHYLARVERLNPPLNAQYQFEWRLGNDPDKTTS